MRVRPRALGSFNAASFPEPMNPFAKYNAERRGLRAYVGAAFPEPSNPFYGNSRPCMGCLSGLRAYVPASFPEPNNPLVLARRGMGCCGGMGQTATGDMVVGGIDLTQLGTSLSSAVSSLSAYTVGGIPVLWLAAGGAALLLLLRSQSSGQLQKKAQRYTAKASYLKSRIRARTAEAA